MYDGFIENFIDLCFVVVVDKLFWLLCGGIWLGVGLGLSCWVGEWCEDDELFDKGEVLKISFVLFYKWLEKWWMDIGEILGVK